MTAGPLHQFRCMMRLAGFTPVLSTDGTAILGPRGSIRQAWEGSGLLRTRVKVRHRTRDREWEEAAGDFYPADLPSGCAALINIGVAEAPDAKKLTGSLLGDWLKAGLLGDARKLSATSMAKGVP